MKTIHTPASRFRAIVRELEAAGRTTVRLAKSGARSLRRMPWPVLLVIAIALAALITIVPIVLALFVGLLLLKLLAIAIFGQEPRRIKHYTDQ